MATTKELNEEKNNNVSEIKGILIKIKTQDSKSPVNELYGRINYLTERNTTIEYELNMMCEPTKDTGEQLEKSLSIATGGGVNIRPSDNILRDSRITTGGSIHPRSRGNRYVAIDPNHCK